MPNNSSNIGLPKSGMITDLHDLNMEKGQYSFALNAVLENTSGDGLQIQNDASNILAVNFPDGFIVIGRKFIPEMDRTIYALLNPTTGDSEIGEVINCVYNDDVQTDVGYDCECEDCPDTLIDPQPLENIEQSPYCEYRPLLQEECLSFNINNPVDIEYRVTNRGLNIYFVDYLNPDRFAYFDFNNDGDLVIQDRFREIIGYNDKYCNVPIYSNTIDCNKLKYNPEFSRPCIEYVDVVSGGNLIAGSYQVMVAYSDAFGNSLTKYFPASNRIPIKERDITIETNYETGKALNIKINNLEQSGVYSHYNIVIVETVDNYPEFRLVATLPITQEYYIYTRNSSDFKKLTSDDVFYERPIYYTSKSITKANDYLFKARVKEHKKMNLQRVANRVKLYWQTKALKEKDLTTPLNSANLRSFLRDEVYPMGIVFEIKDDNDTIGFHIPGPSKQYFLDTYTTDVDSIINNNDVITDTSCAEIETNKLWQVYNTAKIIGTPHLYSATCGDNNCWEWGDFAYWESIRNYPNEPEIWGELCGKPIRHHKFPDSLVSHFHDGLNGNNGFTIDNIAYPIGIKVDHDSIVAALDWAVDQNIITAEERSRITGYRIVRGNRAGHKSIIAKGLLYDVWSYQKDSSTYFRPNYPYNDLRPDQFIAPSKDTYQGSNTSNPVPTSFVASGRYTFHSPDVHFSNPSIGNILKIETEEYGKSEGFFNLADEQPKYALLSTVSRTLAFGAGVAAAISSITKQCRTITKNKTYVSALGVSSGSIVITTTDPTTQLYNTAITPTPVILPESVEMQDCKGTAYQWLSPGHIPALFPGNATAASLMTLVAALGGGTTNLLYLFTLMLQEIEVMTNLIKSLTPKKNMFIQYNSEGKYNNYKNVANSGNKIRAIDAKSYLIPKIQSIDELTNSIKFNNWNRESSVYLKITGNDFIPSPSVIDNSRVSMDESGLGYNDLNINISRDISSYYSSIKNFVPDQYGTIYDIEYLETSGCPIMIDSEDEDCTTLYGGDTFITRFALKRKMPFFIQTRFRQQEGTDVQYSLLGNAGFPNYYMDYGEGIMEKMSDVNLSDVFTNPGAFFQDLVGTDDSRMDAKTTKFFYQNGYIHLYNYGIPYFLVESDVNVPYRHGENNLDKDFYPHQKDLAYWLQEKNVPITVDNYYFYNKSYSRQNKESIIKNLTPKFRFNDEKEVTFDNRLIYSESEKNGSLQGRDNWLVLKANNFYDTNLSRGKIISVDGIEDLKVIIRNEQGSQIFGAFDTLQTISGNDVEIGTGGIFQNRPQDFSVTDLGYMGSQHRDILKTEFGHLWVDAKRGQIFLLSPGGKEVDELSKYGKRNWFKENLPFSISKHFKDINLDDLDNNYKGIGLHLGFDKRFNRFFITKLDYKPLNTLIHFNNTTRDFSVDGTKVELTNPAYFCNKSWTISFNLLTKSWASYHSYIPNFYVDFIDSFQTGIRDGGNCSAWTHNITDKSYQVYYGKPYPFAIDVLSEPNLFTSYINSIEYVVDVLRYHNNYNWVYNRNVTFNKAMIYNERQHSGILELIPKNEEDLSTIGYYPNYNGQALEIEVDNSQNTWGLNEFYDIATCQTNNMPLWVNDCNNVDKSPNPKALNYYKSEFDKARILGRNCHVKLINDKWSNYKFIFFITQFNQNRTFR